MKRPVETSPWVGIVTGAEADWPTMPAKIPAELRKVPTAKVLATKLALPI